MLKYTNLYINNNLQELRVGTTIEIRMQIKTFYPNSILLSVSDPRKDLLSLEMIEEKVSSI